jgi:hypothetical protein
MLDIRLWQQKGPASYEAGPFCLQLRLVSLTIISMLFIQPKV